MPYWDINYLAVIVAALSTILIGAIWYSPLLFGNAWMKQIGKTMNDLKQGANTGYLVAILASLVSAFILAQLNWAADVASVKSGVKIALWCWFGFTFASTWMNYSFAGRSWKLVLIDSGYFLVSFIVMGAILGGWR